MGKAKIYKLILLSWIMQRILDTSEIDMDDLEIRGELEIDLQRMDKLEHYEMPDGSDTFHVRVRPGSQTYRPGLHRFTFEIQYGNLINGEFRSKGEPVFTQSEALPYPS